MSKMPESVRCGLPPGRVRRIVLLSVASLSLVALPALAQVQRSGGGGANPQIMQQYQQLASEKTALQTENAKLKQDLDAAAKERDSLKKERDALKAKLSSEGDAGAKVAAATQAAEQNLEQQRKKTEELVARYRELATQLQSSERERADLQALQTRRTQEFNDCADRNAKLRDIVNDVLNRYQQRTWFAKASMDEPFIRLTRTRAENLVLEDRARADALAVRPVTDTAAPVQAH